MSFAQVTCLSVLRFYLLHFAHLHAVLLYRCMLVSALCILHIVHVRKIGRFALLLYFRVHSDSNHARKCLEKMRTRLSLILSETRTE